MHGLRVDLRMARLDERAVLPVRATHASAGMDLHALERTEVTRGEATLVRTGLAMALPAGWEAQIRCRSSLGRKGLIMPNGLGTIDADYRGELMVMMTWIGEGTSYVLEAGERVAQLLVAPVPEVNVVACRFEDLGETERGEGGFGSSGRF
ncbi:MAG: dUTP diphosphatase [Candidatus Poseidoniaceae archaeon]|nr:dUTP diphosphatase [Candidatus Poseidoniaceae archaeon]